MSTKNKTPLCNLNCGWKIVYKKAEIYDISLQEGLPIHLEKAKERWNIIENYGFKLSDIKYNYIYFKTGALSQYH